MDGVLPGVLVLHLWMLHLALLHFLDLHSSFFKSGKDFLFLVSFSRQQVLGRAELVLSVHQLLLHSIQIKDHVVDGLELGQKALA